jgi:hypothetical protein
MRTRGPHLWTCGARARHCYAWQGQDGHIKPIPEGEDFAVGAAPALAARSGGIDQEALDRALAVRLQQVSDQGHSASNCTLIRTVFATSISANPLLQALPPIHEPDALSILLMVTLDADLDPAVTVLQN